MSNQQHQNDLSLLRPFDLEAAKNGEEICWSAIKDAVTFVGVANNSKIAYDSGGELGFTSRCSFRMKPLCWVEGKPVYKGDVLWYKDSHSTICTIKVYGYNPRQKNNSGLTGFVVQTDGKYNVGCDEVWAPFSSWTWNKPKQKVKRKVWINVYPEACSTYLSEHLAYVNAYNDRIACVETEIEYEV